MNDDVKRSRWLDWTPKEPILENSPQKEPSKPSKPTTEERSEGFEDSFSGESQKIAAPDAAKPSPDRDVVRQDPEPLTEGTKAREEALPISPNAAVVDPDPAEQSQQQAVDLLNRTGVRMIFENGKLLAVGIWSDLDSREIRDALRTVDLAPFPVRYLDGSNIPVKYKTRTVAGEPVPLSVLAEMERHINDQPCKVRDGLLKAIDWTPQGIGWADLIDWSPPPENKQPESKQISEPVRSAPKMDDDSQQSFDLGKAKENEP